MDEAVKKQAAAEYGREGGLATKKKYGKKHYQKLALHMNKVKKQKTKEPREIRQGDVRLSKIDKLPTNAKPLKDKILAYGEVTGHSHRFITPENILRYEIDNRIYLQVLQPSQLTHEEHNQWQKRVDADMWMPDQGYIMPGVYEQIQEREYDYVEESSQAVID